MGNSAVAGPSDLLILTLDSMPFPSTPADEQPNSSRSRQTARNGYVVLFSFFGSNASPFFHTVKASVAILRARVSRAISGRMPFCFSA
jgi:hypothetical protein